MPARTNARPALASVFNALAVECPDCEAARGAHCSGANTYPHQARQNEAARLGYAIPSEEEEAEQHEAARRADGYAKQPPATPATVAQGALQLVIDGLHADLDMARQNRLRCLAMLIEDAEGGRKVIEANPKRSVGGHLAERVARLRDLEIEIATLEAAIAKVGGAA
jgi:hypothetical protein